VTSSPTDPQDADVYDSRAYWSALHRRGGLKAVGQSGLPEGFNRWLYKIGRGNVVRFLDAHGCGDLSDLAVLDVGSGTAASKLAAAERPGGRLLLAEPALRRPTSFRPPKPGATSLARPLSRYREVFEAGGLRMIAVGASTVVGANPIEAGDPLYRWYAALWKRVGRSARRGPRRANVLGGFLAALDRVLMATGAAPSGKLILFERPAIPKVP
jgi:hypothetical protein